MEYYQNFIPTDENPAEPVIELIYPIIDQKESLRIDTKRINDNQLVGTLSFKLFWRDLLRNILPETAEGILVVTENACAQVFTYEINGATTTYLSNTDLRNPKYDHLDVTTSFCVDFGNFGRFPKTNLLHGRALVRFDLSHYNQNLTSVRNEEAFVSEEPRILAVTAGLIFVLAVGLFLLYGFLIDLRKKENSSTVQQT